MGSIDFHLFGNKGSSEQGYGYSWLIQNCQNSEKSNIPTYLFMANLSYLVHSRQVEKQTCLKKLMPLILESDADIGFDQRSKCM